MKKIDLSKYNMEFSDIAFSRDKNYKLGKDLAQGTIILGISLIAFSLISKGTIDSLSIENKSELNSIMGLGTFFTYLELLT